jgi:hypothetical protein
MRNICRLSVLAFVSFCSAFMTPVLYAQPKEAQPVLLTRGSGEIFYKKGEGTSKPKFTEVDISQYATGRLYGELKVSGTCDGSYTTALAPTENKKETSTYFVVGGNKSGAGDLGLLTIKDGVLLGPNVSKFYITSDLPVAGMALWYAASCNSTYEISIYVKSGKKICGTLPPIRAKLKKLLADLAKTKSYKERSDIYHAIHEELQKRGIGAGFFEAASVTTDNIHWSPDLDTSTQEFLNSLSQELAVMNAQFAVELLQTGKLANENKSGNSSYPSQIDREMVRREQAYAEKKLSSLPNRSQIVGAMNKEMNGMLDGLLSQGLEKMGMYNSLIAARNIRDQKRKSRRDPNAQFDYGDVRDRVGVGEILSGKFRNENLPNGILCR